MRAHIINSLLQEPYAGIVLTFLVKDSKSTPQQICNCLASIKQEDLEFLFNYEIDILPQLIKQLRLRDIDRELVGEVFSAIAQEGKAFKSPDKKKGMDREIRTKDKLKLLF